MTVPTAAVVIDGVWQILQPIWLKSPDPTAASAVIGPRPGARVARMNRANTSMSSPPSSPQLTDPFDAHGWSSSCSAS
jgi:hypothetical protein